MRKFELPLLYDTVKSGKIKQWKISVQEYKDKCVITTETGLIDGKMTEFNTDITEGKNKNRANETSVYEQAISEATSKWNKKKDQQGYTETKISNKWRPILPMLCVQYTDRKKDLTFPIYVQPKIDGLRAIYQKENTTWNLYSRLGNAFPHLTLILNELKSTNMILDGELFSFELTFQEINGLVRKKTLNETDIFNLNKIKYYVYDTVSDDPFTVRLEILITLFKKNSFKNLVLCPTEVCLKDSDIVPFHNKYVSEKFEGIILRNASGKYEEKVRSKNLQKYKTFLDSEYTITGFTEGEGSEKGAIIWICSTGSGQSFNVRPAGSIPIRKKLFKQGNKYIGKLLTVKYFELTDEGIPRFPTTLYGDTADIRKEI
jgi:DNA ligase-1